MTSSAFLLPFAFSLCLSPSLFLSLSRLVSLFLCLSTHLCTDTMMNYYKQQVQKCVCARDRINLENDGPVIGSRDAEESEEGIHQVVPRGVQVDEVLWFHHHTAVEQ